jgi:hypothetical protein
MHNQSLHRHPFLLTLGHALLLAACNVDSLDDSALTEAEAESVLESRDEAEVAPPASAPDDELHHPYARLAEHSGPIPLFEALDDEAGRRYVIQDGGEIGHDGVFRQASVVGTMTRVDPKDAEIVVKPTTESTRVEAPVITPALAKLLERTSPDEVVAVELSLPRIGAGIQVELDRLVAHGHITTKAALASERERLVLARQQQVAIQIDAAEAAIAERGGRVMFRCRNSGCLQAQMPAGQIDDLIERIEIVHADTIVEPIEAGVDGQTVRDGAQIEQFFDAVDPGGDASYDGAGPTSGTSDDIMFAVIESGAGYAEHDGFDQTSSGGTRIVARYDCSSGACVWTPSYGSASSHATAVAGILFGDLSDGQGTFDVSDEIAGSGYAPEARGYFLAGGVTAGLDHIVDLNPRPDLVSNSWGLIESPECSGRRAQSISANGIFLDGTAVFAAAHNRGGDSSNCKVTSPGSAIGVFTVGAHIDPPNPVDGVDYSMDDVRYGPIRATESDPSSFGGNINEGQNRSIIDLTGPSTRLRKFGNSGNLIDSGGVCCTSLATPTIASAAMAYMDFFRQRWSTYINSPGVLYANMLLMGDRQTQFGKGSTNPDHHWGMGRLRMRMTGNGQLDVPWYFNTGETCVSHGEVWDLTIGGGGAVDDDVEAFKFAAYWYDHRHDGSNGEGAGLVADVDVSLRDAGAHQTIISDVDGSDNKARLFRADIGGITPRVRFTGYNIAGHVDPICGANSIRVFYAYFFEDSDREAPTYDLATGTGVFPEDI